MTVAERRNLGGCRFVALSKITRTTTPTFPVFAVYNVQVQQRQC
jgi:hypothetical protein